MPGYVPAKGDVVAASIDFRSRRTRFIEKVPDPTIEEVLSILDACLY